MPATASTTMQRVIPVLLCDDLASSLHFYVHTLGFDAIDHKEHGGKEDWHFLRRGRAEIILSESGEAPSQIDVIERDRKAAYYFFPDDLEALHEELMAKGAHASPVRMTADAMSEFELLDPDGHVLVFGQSVRELPAS